MFWITTVLAYVPIKEVKTHYEVCCQFDALTYHNMVVRSWMSTKRRIWSKIGHWRNSHRQTSCRYKHKVLTSKQNNIHEIGENSCKMSDLVGFEAPRPQRCKMLFKGLLKLPSEDQKCNIIIYCCGPEIMDLTCTTLGIYQMSKREISASIGSNSKNISSHNQILFKSAIACKTCNKITDLSMSCHEPWTTRPGSQRAKHHPKPANTAKPWWHEQHTQRKQSKSKVKCKVWKWISPIQQNLSSQQH